MCFLGVTETTFAGAYGVGEKLIKKIVFCMVYSTFQLLEDSIVTPQLKKEHSVPQNIPSNASNSTKKQLHTIVLSID